MKYLPFKRYLREQEEQQSEAISHLPHIGELLYTGDPHRALQHLEAVHQKIKGKSIKGHALSYKADGKVSILFGKRNGIPYVKYKGGGSPELYSEQEIHDHVNQTGKHHLLQPFLYGFQAASHPDIDDHHSFQGDVMVPSEDGTSLTGNIVQYKKPRPTVSHSIAVHTQLHTPTGKKIAANPDVSFLESSGSHFPNLGLDGIDFNISDKDSEQVDTHIQKARSILSDPTVSAISQEIAAHRDPTNKTGHRHLHLVKFANAVQRGTHARSISSLIDWTKERAAGAKGKEQQRLQAHGDYIQQNARHIDSLLSAHNHIDSARSFLVDAIHRSDKLPMTPEGGHEEGEGFVSELPDAGQVKLVPTSFTIKNNENKERFTKLKAKS